MFQSWDVADHLIATAEANGRKTTTIYDSHGWPTDSYGPADYTQFSGLIGNSTVTHSTTAYDGAMNGLAAAWYDNGALSGTAKTHTLGTGTAGGEVYNDWPSPPNGMPGAYSLRLTGDITLAAAGNYNFTTWSKSKARVYVDDNLISDSWTDPDSTWVLAAGGVFNNPTAGSVHRIRVDMANTVGQSGLQLHYLPPGGAWGTVPGTVLKPRYGLATTTVADPGAGHLNSTTTTSYTAANGIGPQHGLATATTVDPGGLNLTTTTAYETPGPGTYLRRTSKTLPSGAASTINDVYYANTEMRTNPCPSGGSANQGGRLKMSTDADPDGAGAQLPIQHETIYDTLGRPVATRTGTGGTGSWVCTTYDTRSRPTTVAYPAYGAGTARTVTYNYAVGGNPFVSSVTDPAGTITTTIDLLGRVTNYTDVWGKTTTTSYDLAGRATSSTTTGTAALTRTYDNAGRLETLSTGGLLLADPHYDTFGRLDSVAYPSGTGKAGNGTTGVFTYDTNGRPSGVTWTGPGGTITSDAVTARDILGRITDQTTDGVDPYPAGVNDVYDKAGRLTTARTTGHTYTYNFAATNTCGTATAAGKNTNRTSMVDNAATTSYCYDNADRLTSTTDGAVGTLAYDSHGNTTTISGETHGYDSADRHLTTTKGATNVTYTRDATDRIVQRATGSFIVRYSNPGGGDTPSLTLDGTSNIVEQTLALPGGAMYTTRTGGNVWSYPNTHSDYVAVANQTGAKQGATATYDPYGNTTTGAVPDNSAGQMDYGWLGQPQRPTEQQTGPPTHHRDGRPPIQPPPR